MHLSILTLTVPKNLPKLDIKVKTHYNLNTIVNKEALVAHLMFQYLRVTLKTGKVDVESFDSEYWLDKQGVRFGSGSEDRFDISYTICVLITIKFKRKTYFCKSGIFHWIIPYIHLPYQEDAGGRWNRSFCCKLFTASE